MFSLLHQTWKNSSLPENFAYWRASFIDQNPGIEARLYDDEDNRSLVASTFPGLLPLYDAFPREIFRVDFVRPIYLFTRGGTYADLDYQCLRPLKEAFGEGSALILGRMGTDDSFPHAIPNAFMASTAGQAFWLGYLATMERRWEALRSRSGIASMPEHVTGPVVLKRTVDVYRQDMPGFARTVRNFVEAYRLDVDLDRLRYDPIALQPAHKLYPLDWNDRIHQQFRVRILQSRRLLSRDEALKLFPKSVAVTYWAHSW